MFLHSSTECLTFSTFKGNVSTVEARPNRASDETEEIEVISNTTIVGNG